MRRILRETWAGAALLVVALCLSAASARAAEPRAAEPHAAEPRTAEPRAAEPLGLAQYRGRVVLVDFWASWCEPCRHSFPWLNEMQAKYGDRLVVIGVNVDRERADAERFLAQVPAHFNVIYDPKGELATRYEVMGMPSSFVFDTSGTLVDQHIGFRKSLRSEREEQLRKLLHPTSLQSRTHP